MFDQIQRLVHQIQNLQTEKDPLGSAPDQRKRQADIKIRLIQKRKTLFHLLETSSTLDLLFHPDLLTDCRHLLLDYLNQSQRNSSKWTLLFQKIEEQLDIVRQLHEGAGRMLEELLQTSEDTQLWSAGLPFYAIREQLKEVVRAVEHFFTTRKTSPLKYEQEQILEAVSDLNSSFPSSNEEIPQFPGISVMEKVEAYFRTYFHYLETQGYQVAHVHELVKDLLFEIRQERGLRVKGLFIDRSCGKGCVDDIVVILEQGTGKIFHGVLASRRMQLAVENAVEAAIRYTEDVPDAYNISWQVRNIRYEYEGESLGLAIAVSVLARLLEQPIPSNLAFTGVVTKDGEITRVGGITQKIKAARSAGIEKILIPLSNRDDVPEGWFQEGIIPVCTLEEALYAVFPHVYDIYAAPLLSHTKLYLKSIKRGKYLENLYVNRTQIEEDVEHFLASDKSGLVILGNSGVGKTNLLGYLAERFIAEKHLVLFFLCSTLSENFEHSLKQHFLGTRRSLETSLKKLNHLTYTWNTYLILLFDGLNEYSYGERTPAELLRDLDDFIVHCRTYTRLKIIITCRSVTWSQLERLRKAELSWACYYTSNNHPTLQLQEFTPEEFKSGYQLYQQAFNLRTEFDQLSLQTRQRCRDPLMLKLVAQVNQHKSIPWDAPTFVVFAEYLDQVLGHQLDVIFFLNNLVEEMFVRNTEILSLLDMHQSGKFNDIDSQSLQSTYIRLQDSGVLLERGGGLLPEVRFMYDRFFEYLLARHLLEKMKREGKDRTYLLELTQRYRQFPALWGTLQSMLLLHPLQDWWRIMAESNDYVARGIFVDAAQTYFQEQPERAARTMTALLDDTSFYSTQTVLRTAKAIGEDAIDIFEYAMKSRADQTQRVLINFLFSLSKENIDLYFFLYDHYAALMTPLSIAKNGKMAIGGIQNLIRIISASMNEREVLRRCSLTFQKTAERLHLMMFSKDNFIDRSLEAMTMKTLPLLMRIAVIGGFLEIVALHEFENLGTFFENKAEQQKVARLLPYLDMKNANIETKIEQLRYIFDEAPSASKALTASILAVQMNSRHATHLKLYKELFEQCNGYGRSWMQSSIFALFIPTSFPKGYLKMLEEIAITYVNENRDHLFEKRILLQEIIDCPFLSLLFSYYREGIPDMPAINLLIGEAIANDDQALSKRLIETLFPLGIFYPEFLLNFIDQHIELSKQQFNEVILPGLGLLLPLHPEITDLYIERWNFTPLQKDIIYANIDYERAYKAYEYIIVFNVAEQVFLNKTALTPLGAEMYDHFVTCDSLNDAVEKIIVRMFKTLREYKFDLVKIFMPEEKTTNHT